MARAFILGHGARVPGREKTFVPEGKSISFYSKVDENTLRSNGLAALNAGDIPPVETFKARSKVDNYSLGRFEDRAIAQHMASESSLTGGTTYFIGMDPLPSPLALCTSPQACDRTKPNHSASCKGLFALVPEDELVSVTCRGVLGKTDNPATSRLGARKRDAKGHDTSKDFSSETTAEAERLLALGKTDPAAAIAQVESLSEPTRQMLFSSYVPLRTFVEGYYKQGGAATPEAVLEARRALEALGEDSFADHVDGYGAKQKQMVLADTALKAAYDRSVKKRTQTGLKEKYERERPSGLRNRIDPRQKQARVGRDTAAKTGSKQAVLAKLSELSKENTDDPYRTIAIDLAATRLAKGNKTDV